jgi:tRNA U34 2-thiouridine synthase MnmA/TrmU
MTKKEYDNLYKEYSQDSYKVGKYQRAGIYCIQINDVIVYVGKSIDMLSRVVGHVLEIKEGINGNKYKVLHEASQREDCAIKFDVLYKSRKRKHERIIEDIGEAEAKYINELRPALNY